MAMRSKVFTYQAVLHWQGGHTASVTSGDRPELSVTPPPDFPDGRGDRWSPEHLFLAALESCTMLSFLAHCEHNDLEVDEYSAAATGSVERRSEDQRYAFTHVNVVVSVRMAPGRAQAARELTAKAERDCFITASTTAHIETEWRIIE
jgi:organic hydroperoxide reductase OsmC/OhrA